MKALLVKRYGMAPVLTEMPLPTLDTSHALIKMKYAPVNPSDLNFYLGSYGLRKEDHPIVGFEGSGVVIESSNHSLVDSCVSVTSNMTNGTFATHIVCSESQLIRWPKGADYKLISMGWINPMSCIGLCDLVTNSQAETTLVSAASSSLGKSIIGYLHLRHPQINVIGMTRSSQHDAELIGLGAKQIVNNNDVDAIRAKFKGYGKTVFLDCVGGQFAGKMFNALAPNSVMVNYGRLAKEHLAGVDVGQLYFANKTIRGFWLNKYLRDIGVVGIHALKQKVVDNWQILQQKVRKVYPLEDFRQAFHESLKGQSNGKILFDLS